MSEEQKLFIREMRSVIIKGILGMIGAAFIAGVAFYYNTKKIDEQHSYRIEVLERSCARQTEIDIKLNYIQNSINELKYSLKEK
jgi:hypothetical protein